MDGTKIDADTADRVWSVLVNVCGASEADRWSFVHNAGTDGITEWRFQGRLGFGGKFWGRTFKVNCYREDESPERLEIIERANKLLASCRS